ncbi:unnamed protein product [Zymoseptoria tritici ST99CH_3D1]|nr:unnamed protein product [Zymoseptoria tritici ST99CH_3D1]
MFAAAVTAVVLAFFAFRMGRKGTIILGNIAAIIGSVIQATSYSVAQLIVGRLVQGISIGAISSAVPTYLSETGVEIGDRGPANALNAILLISEYAGEILAAIEAELEANASLDWKPFLTMGIVDKSRMKIVRRICMCFWLPMVREWMGSSLIAYYSSVILSTVAKPSLVSLLSGVLNIFFALGCVPLYFTVEKVGRRSILLYGAIAMTTLLTIFTVLVALGSGSESRDWAAVGIIFIFLFVFGWTWQGSVWLYCSEIAPLEYRHIGAAATACGEWLMTFVTVFAGPIGFERIGWYFWLWVISGNLVAIVFVFLLCPETGGKTLEQVDYLFVRKGFAGLRSNFDITTEDMEGAPTKEKLVVDQFEVANKR